MRKACHDAPPSRLSRRSLLELAVSLPLLGVRGAKAEPASLAAPFTFEKKLTILRQKKSFLPPPAGVSEILSLTSGFDDGLLELRQDQDSVLKLINKADVGVSLCFQGLRGSPALGWWEESSLFPAGTESKLALKPVNAGTFLIAPPPFQGGMREAGLAGVAVAYEKDIPDIDSDSLVLFKDVRLARDGSIPPSSGARLGNALTVNGRLEQKSLTLRVNERHRLRMVNASSARVLVIEASGFLPLVIALDGAPCEAFEPAEGKIVLAPGARADVLVEFNASPAAAPKFLTHIGPLALDVVAIRVADTPPLRQAPLPPFLGLPMDEESGRLDLAQAQRISLNPRLKEWRKDDDSTRPPIAFSTSLGRTLVLEVQNPSDGPAILTSEAFHLRPLDGLDDGVKPYVLDTILLAGQESLLLAFNATRSGRFGLHWRGLTPPFEGFVTSFEVG